MKKRYKIFGFLIIFSKIFYSCISLYILAPFPVKESDISIYPQSFYISKSNKFEIQPPGECAGYSLAFVLRHFGENEEGEEVYKNLGYKIPISGYVFPKGIMKFLKAKGFEPKIIKGDLEKLKSALAEKGNPVIVLIGRSIKWQHWMTLVGYDTTKKELYFYDSKKETDENGNLPGNRTLSEEYFSELWDNGLPIFNHVYITVDK